jgi:aldehyde dehydrogenase (NAD+)
MKHYPMRIGGEWVDSPARIIVRNPATGEQVATAAAGTPGHIEQAVKAAREGARKWAATAPAVRADVLYRVSQRLLQEADSLAALESSQTGGSIFGSRMTVQNVAARRFAYFAGWADKLTGRTADLPMNTFGYTRMEPLGVTVHIVPWNGPLWTGTRSIAPALAAGNSLVVKPAVEAPLSLVELARICEECGLPPGVFNVVNGDGPIVGGSLVAHPDIDGVWFTGSTRTGREVLRTAAEHITPVVVELGGKSPNIVLADAPASAVQGASMAIFANAGQICVAGSRLLVDRRIHDQFVEQLAGMARRIRLGGPEDQAEMGPLISAARREAVLGFIERARESATLVTGGSAPADGRLARGHFVEPTIFDDVAPDAELAQEEVFGPVLAVTAFDDVAEAIEVANRSKYGLASAVWTNDLSTAHRVAGELRAGQVYINHYFSSGIELSRSAYGQSGLGVSEGADSLSHFVRLKSVSVRLG